jgi:hypothetical protein
LTLCNKKNSVDFSEAGGVTIWAAQQISVAYTKVFTTESWMSDCHRGNKKEDVNKTWNSLRTHFVAAYRHHKQMQGESATTSGYYSANDDVAQTEDEMAEATIGALANLAMATSIDHGVVFALIWQNHMLVWPSNWKNDLLSSRKAGHCSRRIVHGTYISPLLWITIAGPMDISSTWVTQVRVIITPRRVTCAMPPKGNNMGGSQANNEWLVGATSKNNRKMFEDWRTPPLQDHHETSIVDSGCTCHFLLINGSCHNKTKSRTPLRVRFPNGDTIESTHTASLNIPERSEAASVANVLQTWQITHCFMLANFAMKVNL